ncbi:helix-turn-helix transcriptional regulator [Nonomuraea helvata]
MTCVDDHRGWSAPEVGSRHGLVLVRRGMFRRMADGRAAVLDPTMAYLSVPGEEEHFAHPAGGDVCTSVSLSPRLWHKLAGEGPLPARPTLYVDARLDLAHRRFLVAARGGDPAFELAESLLSLIGAALGQLTPAPSGGGASRAATAAATGTGSTEVSARTGRFSGGRVIKGRSGRGSGGSPGAVVRTSAAIADAAREAIGADHPAAGGLLSLAELLAVSPYQLSRAFTRELGVSLTHYRNRVRVGRALDRLEDGETSLAGLAADLGFADQAHLTRTIRRHAGQTPTALRRLLAARDS